MLQDNQLLTINFQQDEIVVCRFILNIMMTTVIKYASP